MPASLRFVLALLALGAIGAAVAIYQVYRGDDRQAEAAAQALTGGDAARGKLAMSHYGCAACHTIPGLSGANGQVGPSLDRFAVRASIAGVLPNQPDQLIRWLRAPQQVVPGNAMPDQNMNQRDAADIAAYLYTLR